MDPLHMPLEEIKICAKRIVGSKMTKDGIASGGGYNHVVWSHSSLATEIFNILIKHTKHIY